MPRPATSVPTTAECGMGRCSRNQRLPGLDQHCVDTDMAPEEDRVKIEPRPGPQATVVDVDPTELAGRKRLGDARLSHIGDRVQEPAMKDDSDTVTVLILEVHLATVQPVPRARHQGHFFCTDSRLADHPTLERRPTPMDRPARSASNGSLCVSQADPPASQTPSGSDISDASKRGGSAGARSGSSSALLAETDDGSSTTPCTSP
jgi:hypothetical protein